jgi:hypothetical protein
MVATFPRNESAFSAVVGLEVWMFQNLLAGGDDGHRGKGGQWPFFIESG